MSDSSTPLTRCLLRSGSTSVHQDFGNAFAETFRLGVGPGYRCVNVQLAGFTLTFRNSDHPLHQVEVRIHESSYDPDTGELAFLVNGVFRDTGGRDEFTWNVDFTVLALG
jgi:hypothetical protein